MVERIYQLKSMLKHTAQNEDYKSKLLESFLNFKCKNDNSEVEKFLVKNAIAFEEQDISRTYIIFGNNPFDIKAYFNIAVKSLSLVNVSLTKRKEFKAKDEAITAPAFLLAQLGQTADCDLKKYELLDIALHFIKSAQSIVGGRSVYLDFEKSKEKLFDYYYKRGFRYLSEDDTYKQMFMRL